MRNVRKSNGHGRAEFVGFGENISIKKCFTDDAHGEVGHLLIDIDNGIIRPGLLNLFAVMSHDTSIAGNMTRLERWGHELTLATMEFSFATEYAITYNGTEGIMNCQAFVEAISMLDQNTTDILWPIEHEGGGRSKLHATDIVFTRYTP